MTTQQPQFITFTERGSVRWLHDLGESKPQQQQRHGEEIPAVSVSGPRYTIDTLHPPGGQVQVVHDVVEAVEHEDDGGGEGGDVPPVDGDPLLHPPPVPLHLGRVLHYDRVQLLQLVLQKVPSKANPKVRNHREGPY